ncbi:MAG: hypothetical protein Q9221_001435 [Calogaya cf. arnoldii]
MAGITRRFFKLNDKENVRLFAVDVTDSACVINHHPKSRTNVGSVDVAVALTRHLLSEGLLDLVKNTIVTPYKNEKCSCIKLLSNLGQKTNYPMSELPNCNNVDNHTRDAVPGGLVFIELTKNVQRKETRRKAATDPAIVQNAQTNLTWLQTGFNDKKEFFNDNDGSDEQQMRGDFTFVSPLSLAPPPNDPKAELTQTSVKGGTSRSKRPGAMH